jgi:DNA-binding phage protein
MAPIAAEPLGPRLRALLDARRGDRNYTDVAHAAGLSRQNLWKILAGRNPNPKVETLRRILAAVGADLDDL